MSKSRKYFQDDHDLLPALGATLEHHIAERLGLIIYLPPLQQMTEPLLVSPESEPIGRMTFDASAPIVFDYFSHVPAEKFRLTQTYTMQFSNQTGVVGLLDFNGPAMTFTGDADESAKAFLEFLEVHFQGRLKEEFERGRKQGLEEATHVCDNEKWDHQTGAYTIRYIDIYNGACDDCMKAIGRLS